MLYKVRRIKLDNMAEICWRAKRCETYLTLQNLHIGGIYQLHGGKLYVVESKKKLNMGRPARGGRWFSRNHG